MYSFAFFRFPFYQFPFFQFPYSIRKLSTNFLFLQLKLIDTLSLRSTSGSLRGSLFECYVAEALPGGYLVLKNYGNEEEKRVDLTMVCVGDEMANSTLGAFVPETNYCHYTPCMEGVDIIINVNCTIYLIQCSINKNIRKKAGFWQANSAKGWKAVLLAPSHVKEDLAGHSALATQYKEKKFAFSCASHLNSYFLDHLSAPQ